MPALKNIKGNKYNNLTVKERADNINGRVAWKCKCDCGGEKIIRTGDLTTGHIKNCGGCIDKTANFEFKDDRVVGSTWKKQIFYVDYEDYLKIKDYSVSMSPQGYVMLHIKGGGMVCLHRYLMNPEDGYVVDHINRKRFDNRRSNLRICTRSENNKNLSLRKDNTSGHRGVSYKKNKNKYQAYIKLNNKDKHLGQFNNIEDAINARLIAEEKYYGEFAPKN